MFAVIKMELSGKTEYGPVLKTTQLSAHAQNHTSPERCRKPVTVIFLGDHDIPLTRPVQILAIWQHLGHLDLESVSRDAHLAMTVSTKFEVDTTIRCLVIALLLLIRYVTL